MQARLAVVVPGAPEDIPLTVRQFLWYSEA